MDRANRVVLEILDIMRSMIKPGATTAQLNAVAEEELARRGAKSPFKGYAPMGLPPYPAVVCVSANDVIVHGIPSRAKLQDGSDAVLKIGPPRGDGETGREIEALRQYDGDGICRLMNVDPSRQAMLLERLHPTSRPLTLSFRTATVRERREPPTLPPLPDGRGSERPLSRKRRILTPPPRTAPAWPLAPRGPRRRRRAGR